MSTVSEGSTLRLKRAFDGETALSANRRKTPSPLTLRLTVAAQRREANPKISGNLLTRQADRQRYAYCLCPEFFGWSKYHLCSPLRHDTWSKERHNPATGPFSLDIWDHPLLRH